MMCSDPIQLEYDITNVCPKFKESNSLTVFISKSNGSYRWRLKHHKIAVEEPSPMRSST